MEKKRVEKFKKQLLARREELLRSIAQTQEDGKVVQQPGTRTAWVDRRGAGPDR